MILNKEWHLFSIFCVKCIIYDDLKSIRANEIFCTIFGKKNKILLFLSENI